MIALSHFYEVSVQADQTDVPLLNYLLFLGVLFIVILILSAKSK